MAVYADELSKTKFLPNVVILLKGKYFAIRMPDTGLMIEKDCLGSVSAVSISPTAIDPFRPSSATNNFSFKLLDSNLVVTKLLSGDPGYFQRQPVDIWIGRCKSPLQTEAMDFSEYYKLPTTTVQKVSKTDSSYNFQTYESRDRLGTGRFQAQTTLPIDILFNTTIITVTDPTVFPTSGFIQIEKEIISYTGIIGNNLQACIRGELNSVPADHAAQSLVLLTVPVQANPIDILLQSLISKGGGGAYDVLPDGAGIDENMVDITQFLQLKTEFYSTFTFFLLFQNLTSLKDFLEMQILFPLGLRLRTNINGKLGLGLLDRRIFDIDTPLINNDNLAKNPEFTVDDTKITNNIQVSWDWDDGTQQYKQVSLFQDAASIATWGISTLKTFEFKGIKSLIGGAIIINTFQGLFLRRFAQPRGELSASVLLSASISQLADKIDLVTNRIPNQNGELNFAETVELVKSAINYQTGDVKFQLAFTAFTGVRECYIAPSDTILGHSGKSVTLSSGRGSFWRAGWVCSLYDNTARDYAVVQNNVIFSVVGDVVVFTDNWLVPIVDGQHRIVFSDYQVVTAQQRKYCFICQNAGTFSDLTTPYQILFGGG